MPIIRPKKDEKESEYVSRCMADPETQKASKDQKQRLAICYTTYKQSKKKKAAGSNPFDSMIIVVE